MSEIRTDTINNASGDNDSGIDLSTNDQVSIKTANTTRVTVTSSGNVGIGTTSPDTNLDIEGTGDCTLSITAGSTSNDSKIDFVHGTTIDGGITYDHNGAYASEKMAFRAGNNGTHMYLMGDGNFFLGKTNTSSSVEGVRLHSGVNHHITVNGANVILFNRGTNDGQIVGFASQDATQGNISISGSTTSYNAFSASHWSRLTDNSKPTILKGTVIETIDEMCDWYQITFTVPATDDTPEHNPKISIALEDGQSVGDTITYNHDGTDYQATIIQEDDNKHTKCKISDTADSTRVYGVFADWDNDDDTVNDMYVTAVGTHVVRINKDVTVQAGDLLSSNGDGTAKVQDDDIIRSKTLGKVLTNIKQETYDDGSYTVPCALYCG